MKEGAWDAFENDYKRWHPEPQRFWANMTLHTLRHSAATLLLSMGVPLKVIQEILGHSSYSITADIYTDVLPSMQKEAMDKWDDVFRFDDQDGEQV